MVHRSRTRRVLKWAGVLVCVATLSAYGVGPFFAVDESHLWWIDLHDGNVDVGFNRARMWGHYYWFPLGKGYFQVGGKQISLPNLEYGSLVSWNAYLPLWLLLLVAAVATFILFWLDRRRIPPGHCQTCAYNLTGNVSGRCPECGTAVKHDRAPYSGGADDHGARAQP